MYRDVRIEANIQRNDGVAAVFLAAGRSESPLESAVQIIDNTQASVWLNGHTRVVITL
jgi:hypothetical protein